MENPPFTSMILPFSFVDVPASHGWLPGKPATHLQATVFLWNVGELDGWTTAEISLLYMDHPIVNLDWIFLGLLERRYPNTTQILSWYPLPEIMYMDVGQNGRPREPQMLV